MSSPPPSSRLVSIDALRGLVMLIMLLDHVRETFYLHHQVGDPMDVASTPPELFFSRLAAHVCAPVFIFLTGLSAWLYGQKTSRSDTSRFLLTRGFFLVVLEVTLVNFAWTFQFPPTVVYLQVIWVIGLSMIALAALIWLPRPVLALIGIALVAGHNLLDAVHVAPGSALHVPWAILHDRGWIEVSDTLRLRTSYPWLPWIGVIALGYATGPWFGAGTNALARQRRLLAVGAASILTFGVLRGFNAYGQAQPWTPSDSALQSVMSFLNITKYPPSLFFLLVTLGLGLWLLALLERAPAQARWLHALRGYGGAPMFFYLLHLYVLKLLYLGAVAIWGLNQGTYFGFSSMAGIWLCSLLLAVALYPPVRAFAAFKARRRDITWLKYL